MTIKLQPFYSVFGVKSHDLEMLLTDLPAYLFIIFSRSCPIKGFFFIKMDYLAIKYH